MTVPADGMLLRIFVGEADRWAARPLYEAIVLKARDEAGNPAFDRADLPLLRGGGPESAEAAVVMRVSAKLNLYLGVRNLALDFLPPHLLYLGSYFRQRRFNALMPASLLGGSAMVAWLLQGAAATEGGIRVAHVLLAALLVLALVEHLMLVLPMQPSTLWRWALRRTSFWASSVLAAGS